MSDLIPPSGPKNWHAWGLRVASAIDENKPIAGMGTLVSQQSGGRSVHVKQANGVSGYGGPTLHNIPDLSGHIPDPIGIVGDVVEDVIGSITLPDPATLISELSGAFISVLNGGTIPSQATVQGWVNTYLGTTLNSLIGDIPTAINGVLSGLVADVPDILSTYFNVVNGPRPANGDKIYTVSAGICYEVWRQVDGIPASNSIFAVPFTVGEEESVQTWVALTTFPAPNIFSLVDAVTSLVMTGFNSLLSLASNLLVSSIMALFDLIAAILPLIETLIAAAVEALEALIDALALEVAELEARVDIIEGQLANITTIDAIDTAGDAQTITVLGADNTGSVLNDVTWIDSSTGEGYSAQWPIWNGPNPNLQDVDWRTIYYMGQDGVHYAGKFLNLLTGGYPKVEDQPTGILYNPVDVVTCDNGEITILKKDDA